ncbi:putative gustatory receptor 2a [Stomoxys calcitrans]|uniref:Gustatory receptor n=1 Tax=Stomoxys calcitrans TaxID=35570 RepID=A0A1I8PEG2_STOCA|nr:putative gustatory receptor 2a [Stomoxys calcitrans]
MDILESVSILQIIYQIGSLSPWLVDRSTWSLKRCRLLEVYTCLVILVSTALLLYGLFADDVLIKVNAHEIGETVDLIQLVGIRVSHIVSITEALVRKQEQKRFYDQLKEIDGIFEKRLNVNVNNGKFRRLTITRGVLMLCVYIVSEGFILTTHMISTEKESFYTYWIFYMMPLLICGLRYFQMFTAVQMIKRRFDKLILVLNEINLIKPDVTPVDTVKNDIFYKTMEPVKSVAHSTFTLLELSLQKQNKRHNVENPDMKRLLIIRDLYNRLYLMTGILNRFFGISMLVNLGNDFISITSNCYWIFINFKNFAATTQDFLQIAGSAVWSVPHLLNVLILAILCERTVQSTTSIALGLHRINIDTMNDNHNSVIQQFSLQLLHQKMAITAAGFFNIDCSLLYTIVGSTTTYLIILIQFHLSETES